MMCHYPDLGSTFDWSCCKELLLQPIRSTTQIWLVTCHHYGISSLIPQMSSRKCQLFSKATLYVVGVTDLALVQMIISLGLQ